MLEMRSIICSFVKDYQKNVSLCTIEDTRPLESTEVLATITPATSDTLTSKREPGGEASVTPSTSMDAQASSKRVESGMELLLTPATSSSRDTSGRSGVGAYATPVTSGVAYYSGGLDTLEFTTPAASRPQAVDVRGAKVKVS